MSKPAPFKTQTLKLPKPGGLFERGKVELAFEPIPAGSFMIGERDGEVFDGEMDPPVKVSFSAAVDDPTQEKQAAYYLGRFPVTQAQFDCWRDLKAYASWRAGPEAKALKGEQHVYEFKGRPTAPADSVSWYEAMAYCAWLNKHGERVGIPKGFVARLPTETEWEYACRAGTDTEYHSGDGAAALAAAGWFDKDWGNGPLPVGQLQANAWGLRDLHGNVWEWCSDKFNSNAYRECLGGRPFLLENLEFASDDAHRVLRGGSWLHWAANCRSAIRDWLRPSSRVRSFGFRVGLFPVSGASQPESGVGAGAFPDGAAERAEAGQAAAPTEPLLDLSEETF